MTSLSKGESFVFGQKEGKFLDFASQEGARAVS